jgi:hypothetical protein
VLQTASNFLHGFLGPNATVLGRLVSVTSKGLASAIGDSLAPSDMCPNFKDASGGTNKSTWDAIWQPQVQKRLQALIQGNLTLTLSDVNLMPYLCGFESQITGRLSPFCDVFTDEELKMYEYSNDLRYYYGIGPGTDLPRKMMTPFLNALVGLLQQGPGTKGVGADGSTSFALPKLLMAFLNDGQLTELVTASGVFDAQQPLSATEMDDDRLWHGSRFVTMRGTIAFERLNCLVPTNSTGPGSNATTTSSVPTSTSTRRPCRPRPTSVAARSYGGMKNETFVRIRLNDQVYPVPGCRSGPGSSCPLESYAKFIQDKYASEGNWVQNCNVTEAGAPTTVKGASFFTNLAQPHLRVIPPY